MAIIFPPASAIASAAPRPRPFVAPVIKGQKSNPLAWTFYWIYPIATAMGGAIAGSFLHLNT